MKNILLLGATGSIGKSVLSVISENKNKFNLMGISFNRNYSKGEKIINNFLPKYVYIDDHDCYVKNTTNNGCIFLNGDSSLEQLIKNTEIDIIICATSGFAGLKAASIAVTTGKKILLANKESIVAGGDLIIPLAKKHSSEIIPIDSEHNAIFQCLSGENGTDDVQKVIITASGGPFLNSSISDLKNVTLNQALNHPNWEMGNKVTIDSATLVNKCLELIEAKYLFNLEENIFELIISYLLMLSTLHFFFNLGSAISMKRNNSLNALLIIPLLIPFIILVEEIFVKIVLEPNLNFLMAYFIFSATFINFAVIQILKVQSK